MCGLFAYLNNRIGEEQLKMLSTLGSKRGPESHVFTKVDEQLYMGFHRLAINGLNEASNQPLIHKHYSLICNGEIYNHKELSAPYTLQTQSDCEVILHLYEEYGCKAFEKLDGEFAFILYDALQKNVIVVRDAYGLKPLYEGVNEDGYMFSSVLESLTKESSYVKQVKPGTYTLFTYFDEGFKKKEQSNYVEKVSFSEATKEEHYKNVYDLLEKAVLKRLTTSERPVCCLLSGGLDSSLVCAIASKYYREKGETLTTYSIGMKGGEDLYYANLVAHHIKSNHHEVVLTQEEFIQAIPNVIRDIESYDVTTVRASVGNWLIGKYIKETSDFKVVLNGDGADELMGGYLYFNACKSNEDFHNECVRLLKDIHYFDVLRSDRCISSHGLESRTPYLDKDLVPYYLSIPISYRRGRTEKEFMRRAISSSDLLPSTIVWRKKEAFSDGVSSPQNSWYLIIQQHLKDYTNRSDLTNEKSYYMDLFIHSFGRNTHVIPYYWMPRFVESNDPSARTLKQRVSVYEYFYRVKHFFTHTFVNTFRKFFF